MLKREWETAREGVENCFRVRMQKRMFLAKEVWVEEVEERGWYFTLQV